MLWQPLNLTEVCPADSHIAACSPLGYVYLNLLVRLFGDSRDRRIQEQLRRERGHEDEGILEGIFNYEHNTDNDEYDFIVVGAGSAGCVVANRLSANPKWKVLLLEAGMEQPDVTLVPGLSTALLGSNIDWSYVTEPDGRSCLARPGGRCTWPRGKVMGGSSSINSMVYVRGNRLDYDGWAALGNPGWSYKDLLPLFKRSEKNLNFESLDRKYHGVDGEQAVSRYPHIDPSTLMMVEALHERGLPLADFNAERQLAVMQAQTYSQDGERVSLNDAFIRPIRYRRRNLTIRPNSEVFKILIDEKNVAYGVRYSTNGKYYTAFARKEVILSAGSINTPKLLMLSGIGPREHLSSLNIRVRKDLAVGRNLQDHASFFGLVVALSNKTATLIPPKQMLEELHQYSQMELKHGPLSANGPVNVGAFMKSDPNLPAPDVQIGFHYLLVKDALMDPVTFERARIFPTGFYDGVYPRIQYLIPKSRGKIVLNASDPHGPPLIYANYFKDPSDMIPMIIGARYFISLENTKAFRSRGARFIRTPLPACRGTTWGSDEHIVCLLRHYTLTIYHPVGTCKMGPKSDRSAVVDPTLKVYGVSRLRVIDASIVPVIVRGNTNAAVMAIAENGVDFVYQDWHKHH